MKPGATEDAINKARDALHAHLASNKRTQQQATDYTDEELLMDERDLEPEFAGKHFIYKCTLFHLHNTSNPILVRLFG